MKLKTIGYTAVFLAAVIPILYLNISKKSDEKVKTPLSVKAEKFSTVAEVNVKDDEVSEVESMGVKTLLVVDADTDRWDVSDFTTTNSYNGNGLSDEERELNRIIANEVREEHRIQRREQDQNRKQWQRALQKARLEAKQSGDYTKYKALKADQPTKAKRLE